MSLHARCEKGQSGYPWLVFLHGFSGDSREWQTVGAAFSAYPRLYIDLPGHGGSREVRVSGFVMASASHRYHHPIGAQPQGALSQLVSAVAACPLCPLFDPLLASAQPLSSPS